MTPAVRAAFEETLRDKERDLQRAEDCVAEAEAEAHKANARVFLNHSWRNVLRETVAEMREELAHK